MGSAKSSIQRTMGKVAEKYPTSRPPPELFQSGKGYGKHQAPPDISQYRTNKLEVAERFMPKDVDPMKAQTPTKDTREYTPENRDEKLHEMLMKLTNTIRVSEREEAHPSTVGRTRQGVVPHPFAESLEPAPMDPRGLTTEEDDDYDKAVLNKREKKLRELPKKPTGDGPPIEVQEDGFLSKAEFIEMFKLRETDPTQNDDRGLAQQFGVRPREVASVMKYYQLPQESPDKTIFEWMGARPEDEAFVPPEAPLKPKQQTRAIQFDQVPERPPSRRI